MTPDEIYRLTAALARQPVGQENIRAAAREAGIDKDKAHRYIKKQRAAGIQPGLSQREQLESIRRDVQALLHSIDQLIARTER